MKLQHAIGIALAASSLAGCAFDEIDLDESAAPLLDSDSAIQGCATGTFQSTHPPVRIPDRGPPITSSLSVTGDVPPRSITVSLTIRHTARGDLRVSLVAPNGSTVVIHNENPHDSADDLVMTVPVNGFFGRPPAGTWQLRVQDMFAVDQGALESWSLSITSCTP